MTDKRYKYLNVPKILKYQTFESKTFIFHPFDKIGKIFNLQQFVKNS